MTSIWRPVLVLAFALWAAPALAQPSGLTCETRGDIRHCWDKYGNTVLTEERSGDYVHGHDRGGAWTTWEHDGRTETWPTR
jgi:hypothetical protein